NTRNLQLTKGSTGDNGLTRHKLAADGTFQETAQLNYTWIVTQIVDQHEGHQLESINPEAYPEYRPLDAATREAMLDAVRHSTASFNTIAAVLNTTHGLSLLGRNVYNRSDDYTQKKGTSTAKFETL
ncbi:hypothetical protein V1517DRAFT_267276, partial [Lipomyces orientalis]